MNFYMSKEKKQVFILDLILDLKLASKKIDPNGFNFIIVPWIVLLRPGIIHLRAGF